MLSLEANRRRARAHIHAPILGRQDRRAVAVSLDILRQVCGRFAATLRLGLRARRRFFYFYFYFLYFLFWGCRASRVTLDRRTS